MIPAFTGDQVRAWRMARNLDPGARCDAVSIARRLGGVQAQVTSSAEQAVAVRGAAPGAVAHALAGRTLVRTWAQRGTLHLLPSDEVGAYLSLLAAARTWEKSSWQRTFATVEQMDLLAEAAAAVLDGAVLTRAELVAAIMDRVGHRTGADALRESLGSGWGALLKPLAWQGVLCNGEGEAGRVTFTSPASWLPGWTGLPDPDAAAAVVVPAYLGAHGPATPAAFDQWLLRGATPRARVKGWFAALVDAGELALVDVDGERRHARTADLDALAEARPSGRVALLPAFDQLVLGPGTGRGRGPRPGPPRAGQPGRGLDRAGPRPGRAGGGRVGAGRRHSRDHGVRRRDRRRPRGGGGRTGCGAGAEPQRRRSRPEERHGRPGEGEHVAGGQHPTHDVHADELARPHPEQVEHRHPAGTGGDVGGQRGRGHQRQCAHHERHGERCGQPAPAQRGDRERDRHQREQRPDHGDQQELRDRARVGGAQHDRGDEGDDLQDQVDPRGHAPRRVGHQAPVLTRRCPLTGRPRRARTPRTWACARCTRAGRAGSR